jgi:hypothetical protein
VKWLRLRRDAPCGACGELVSAHLLAAVGESRQRRGPRQRLVVCRACAVERYGMQLPRVEPSDVGRDGKALAVGED